MHLTVRTEDGLETFLNKDKRKCTLKISFHHQHHHYHNPHQPGEDEEGRLPPEEDIDFDFFTIASTMFNVHTQRLHPTQEFLSILGFNGRLLAEILSVLPRV